MQEKLKEVTEAENKAVDRLKQRYKTLDDSVTLMPKIFFFSFGTIDSLSFFVNSYLWWAYIGKQSRQVQLYTQVPPSDKKILGRLVSMSYVS